MIGLLTSLALAGPRAVDVDTRAALEPRRVAVLIGVDDYDDPQLDTLKFAAKDARDLAGVLGDAAYGDYDEVVVVTGREATTREGLVTAIQDATADLQRDDTFLLYLSGHGTLTLDPLDGTQLWFLPSDGLLAAPRDQGIDVAWLESTLSAVGAKRRVLIMDTCHNGRSSSKSGLSEPTRDKLSSLRGEPPAPQVAEVTESEARLYAAQYYQPAMEDKSLGNGVYTHFLLAALTGERARADLDGDGLVDVNEAHDYAQDRTVHHTGGLQVPRIETRMVGRERIYLSGDPSTRAQAESALFRAYSHLLTSATLWVDGQARGGLDGLVPVEPGTHRVAVRTDDGRTVLDRKMRVDRGSVVHVEDLVGPRRQLWALAGASVWAGALPDYLAPGAAEVEVGGTWAPDARVQPAVYGRLAAGDARARDLVVARQRYALAGAGVFLGAGTHRIRVGPQLEAAAIWRHPDDRRAQAMPAPAVGLRAHVDVPVGEIALRARYDARLVLGTYEDTWVGGVTHGLAVGAAFR